MPAGTAAPGARPRRKPKKMRLDQLLVQRGYFDTRDAASRAVFAGQVTSNDAHLTAPSQMVPTTIGLRVRGRGRFVSRGGDKLQGALDDTGFDPEGLSCIDAGASTGGFTDCLLQNGAARVAAVDVGYGIIDAALRDDPRVALYERTNIKDVEARDLGGPFDLLVADLSFIALGGLLREFRQLVRPDGHLLLLVKPQFEARRDAVEPGGVVNDPHQHAAVLCRVIEQVFQAGFGPLSVHASHLRGGKAGNLEFFVFAGPDVPDASQLRDGGPGQAPGAHASIDVWKAVALAHGLSPHEALHDDPLHQGIKEDRCT